MRTSLAAMYLMLGLVVQVVACQQPDLVIYSMNRDIQNPTSTQAITVTIVIKNQGSGYAGACTGRLQSSSTYDTFSIPGLASSATNTRVINGVGPWAAGSGTLTATADISNAVTESVETNNSSSMQFNVSGGPPSQPTNPSPANGATNVSISPSLSLTPGTGATSRDYRFGTTNPPPTVSSSQTSTSYFPGNLSPNTTYYWGSIERNSYGSTPGPIWSFTTQTSSGGAGELSFTASTVTVSEGAVSVLVSIRRENGTSGSVGISYATSSGSAVSGADFVSTSGTLSWGSGDTTNRSFSITIIDDSIVEGSEQFLVTLSNPTGGALLGSPATTTVTITDNDSPATPEVEVRRSGNVVSNGATDNIGNTFTVGTQVMLTWAIHNLGAANLNLTGNPRAQITAATGCSVAVSGQPSTPIAPSWYDNIGISITPTATNFSFAVSVANDDSNENPCQWTITGGAASGTALTLVAEYPTDPYQHNIATAMEAAAKGTLNGGDQYRYVEWRLSDGQRTEIVGAESGQLEGRTGQFDFRWSSAAARINKARDLELAIGQGSVSLRQGAYVRTKDLTQYGAYSIAFKASSSSSREGVLSTVSLYDEATREEISIEVFGSKPELYFGVWNPAQTNTFSTIAHILPLSNEVRYYHNRDVVGTPDLVDKTQNLATKMAHFKSQHTADFVEYRIIWDQAWVTLLIDGNAVCTINRTTTSAKCKLIARLWNAFWARSDLTSAGYTETAHTMTVQSISYTPKAGFGTAWTENFHELRSTSWDTCFDPNDPTRTYLLTASVETLQGRKASTSWTIHPVAVLSEASSTQSSEDSLLNCTSSLNGGSAIALSSAAISVAMLALLVGRQCLRKRRSP